MRSKRKKSRLLKSLTAADLPCPLLHKQFATRLDLGLKLHRILVHATVIIYLLLQLSFLFVFGGFFGAFGR